MEPSMSHIYINTRVSGNASNLAASMNDRMADYHDMDSTQFAYAGNLDATHVIPSGSSTKRHWAGTVGTTKHHRERSTC